MSFLFGKKKGAHNRDGTPPGSTNSAGAVTPPSSNNSSLNHVYVGAGDMGSPGSKPPGPGRPPGSSGGLPPQRPAHQQHQQTTDPASASNPPGARMHQVRTLMHVWILIPRGSRVVESRKRYVHANDGLLAPSTSRECESLPVVTKKTTPELVTLPPVPAIWPRCKCCLQ